MPMPFSIPALLQGEWRKWTFQPFKEGIEAHWLSQSDPQVAVLRYEKDATVDRHRHGGLETILILEGTQSDERGTYHQGDFVINPANSEHRVWTDTGCVVLLHWQKPVEFLE